MDSLPIKFKSIGRKCKISPFARFYNPENMEIGDNVRIDDFCIISAGLGGIKIGDNVHIACHTTIVGSGRVEIKDFAQISGRVSIYSSTDDFSGAYLVGPTIPKEFTGVRSAPVILEKHALLGCGTVVMPGVTIGEGTSVGAMSFVKKSLPSWGIYAGNPIRFIKERSKEMLTLEMNYLHTINGKQYIP